MQTTPRRVSVASFIGGTWLMHMQDMTHSCAGHDSRIYLTCMYRYAGHTTTRFCRLIHRWDMTHSYAGHDSFICGTWLIHMRDMTHSYAGHDLFICVTWLIHMQAIPRRVSVASNVFGSRRRRSSLATLKPVSVYLYTYTYIWYICVCVWMCVCVNMYMYLGCTAVEALWIRGGEDS